MFSVLSWPKNDVSLSPYPNLFLDLLFKPIIYGLMDLKRRFNNLLIIYSLMSELLFPKSYMLQVAEPGLKSGHSDS